MPHKKSEHLFQTVEKAFHDYYQLFLAFKSMKYNGGSFLFRFTNHTSFHSHGISDHERKSKKGQSI